jgi:hypothetical protein
MINDPQAKLDREQQIKAAAVEILRYLCDDYAGQNADDVARMLDE